MLELRGKLSLSSIPSAGCEAGEGFLLTANVLSFGPSYKVLFGVEEDPEVSGDRSNSMPLSSVPFPNSYCLASDLA